MTLKSRGPIAIDLGEKLKTNKIYFSINKGQIAKFQNFRGVN
jgi:ribosome maturation protein Sdo1